MSGVAERARAFLRERAAISSTSPAPLPGGPSWAYVLGKLLACLLVIEGLTGFALAAFYSPSSTDAWASIAYLEDQTTWGWFVRGLHYHGASALVVICGLHLAQTMIANAYRKPRELVWWLGIALMLLVVAWSLTGYVLRWDQAGFWANRVEIGIAAETPLVGDYLRSAAIGGNEYGNLTLTRFYALHVVALPALVGLLVVGHVVLARRHGAVTVGRRAPAPAWPDQALRDVIALCAMLAILVGVVAATGGAGLAEPADAASAYDARPLWYLRWLFELRALAGSAESVVALVVPGIVVGALVGLPWAEAKVGRKRVLGAMAVLGALIGALTIKSYLRDHGDSELATRIAASEARADRARGIAERYGVPASGPIDLIGSAPLVRARRIFVQACAGCHVDPPLGQPSKRKGPVIGPGFGNRDWLRRFLKDPSGDAFWGRTELVANARAARAAEQDAGSGAGSGSSGSAAEKKEDLSMPPIELGDADLDAVVEAMYAESGAPDVRLELAARGAELIKKNCTDCHAVAEGAAGATAPGLAKLHSRAWFTSFVGFPRAPYHMGELGEMPRFDDDYGLADRDLLGEYLVWLRTATQADIDAIIIK